MCAFVNEEKKQCCICSSQIRYWRSCNCKAGKGGGCKHVVVLLFQLLEYIQLDSKVIPDYLTCAQLLQQWHVPRNDELEEPILYEDVVKKTQEIKDI